MASLGSVVTLAEAISLCKEWRFYVYVLRRPCGQPFYVGKGSGDRICQHERYAKRGENDHRARIIRAIANAGGQVGYEVVGRFEDEGQAFALERELIARFGRSDTGAGPLANYTDGGEGAANPSAHTLSKRAVKLRLVMQDESYKAKAVQSLRSNEPARKENALAAMKTDEYRAKCSKVHLARWQQATPEQRAEHKRACERSRDGAWVEKQRISLAALRADPNTEAKRRANAHSEAARMKRQKSRSEPEIKAALSAKAKIQRANQEAVRQRVLKLHAACGSNETLPNWRSGVSTWLEIEARLNENRS